MLWQVGTNDALAGVPVEEFRAAVQSTLWWLVPIGVIAAFVLIPLGMAGRGWYRNRRDARRYATRS